MKKDYFEILIEEINGKFDLVLEGHAALDKKIDVKFTELNEKIDLNSFKIDALSQKVSELDEKIDNVEIKLNKKIDDVDKKLNKKIDAVDKKISKKIDYVDKKLSKEIAGVAADLKAHRQDTEAHHGVYRVKEV